MTKSQIIDGEEYVSLKEAAEILSVRGWKRAKSMLWNRAKRSIKSGRVFFLKSDVEKIKKEFYNKLKVCNEILEKILHFLETKGIRKDVDILIFLKLFSKLESDTQKMSVHTNIILDELSINKRKDYFNTIKHLEKQGVIILDSTKSFKITSEFYKLMKPYSRFRSTIPSMKA